MDNEFAADLITLIDDEGKEHSFEILDVIENDSGCFYALLPNESGSALDAGSYYIFEVIDDEGEQVLAEVEDEELLNKLAEIFESHFEDLYESSESDNIV